MKPIMKKLPKLDGMTMSLQELIECQEDVAFYLEDKKGKGFEWVYQSDQKITIKLKKEIINANDITISFEGGSD